MEQRLVIRIRKGAHMRFFVGLSICFATFVLSGCAEPRMEVHTVALTDIVKDVEKHGIDSKCKGRKITITAAGRMHDRPDGNPPTTELFTHNNMIRFFITDSDYKYRRGEHYYSAYMRSDLAHIRSHTTYTFTLLIKDISERTEYGYSLFTIWAEVPEHTERADIEIIDTTFEEIVTDVAAGGKSYEGKTVRLQTDVSLGLDELRNIPPSHPSRVLIRSGRLILDTHIKKKVIFWVVDDAVPFPDIILPKFEKDRIYTFTLYIQQIWKQIDAERFIVLAGIADD